MAEDTLTTETTEEVENNNALIEEMLRDAKTTEVPSSLKDNPVIHKGDNEFGAPIVVSSMTDAGYVMIWDTRTYEEFPCLYYMLKQKLQEKRTDGSYRFTAREPSKKPWRGKIKCMLHPDNINRAHYDELGFRVCNKSNITNDFQLKSHMRLKHPQEWKAIQEEIAEKERKENMEYQRAILSMIADKQGVQPEQEKAPLYVSDKEKAEPKYKYKKK